MKVAIFLNSLAPTGTNIATRDFVTELSDKDDCLIDVYTLSPLANGDLEFENVNYITFNSVVSFANYDIIYSCTLRSDIFVFISRILFNRKALVKYISTMHNIVHEDLYYDYGRIVSNIFSRLWLFVKFKNDALVVSSDSMMQYYKQYRSSRNITVIEYGREECSSDSVMGMNRDLKLISPLKAKYRVIGTIGTLSKRKNYILVIDLLKRYDDICWISLGTGEEEEVINAELNRNGLMDRVLFLGLRPDSRPYYKFFDIFFHPSKSEGFALVIIDAMANKTPLLLARLPVYRAILKEDFVSYFDLNDMDSLFVAYDRLMNDGVFNKRCVNKAYEVYLSRFSIAMYGQKYYSLFKKVLKE